MQRAVCTLAVAVAFSAAVTIRVPSQQPTIQAGLNAASSGDVMLAV